MCAVSSGNLNISWKVPSPPPVHAEVELLTTHLEFEGHVLQLLL